MLPLYGVGKEHANVLRQAAKKKEQAVAKGDGCQRSRAAAAMPLRTAISSVAGYSPAV